MKQDITKRRNKHTKIKIKRLFTCIVAAVCLTAALSIGVTADEYSFSGAEATEFYPSKSYESVYGSAYNYGGMNVADLTFPDLPYGVAVNALIGSMEKAPLYGRTATYTMDGPTVSYGVVDVEPGSIYEAPESASGPTAGAQVIYQQTAYTSTSGMVRNDGSIGTLSIPTQNITLKVWEGETNESMAKGLWHYVSTSGWDGNVSVCGHNRGSTYVIGSIKDLQIGDTITYETVYGTRTYSVCYVGTISNTDWSHLQPTADNRITLTTCLADQPNYRVCVQAQEKI